MEVKRVVRRYTMQDLTELTGLSKWAIRKYRQRGLIPCATTDHTWFPYVWTDEHLRLLREIVRIKEQNMRLVDIRDRLNPPTEDE